ncbi:MAG TPA: DUF1003 domain-containing protein [Candidatus Udaeobacter sp.]|jgi:uncharacterized membrane protein|nr:DUF1003 domain-containing protein [Methylomirabilota bacterium]HWN81622.1 DUF1003 domain-containing protein [Candidatus Udaeobacter sp.]
MRTDRGPTRATVARNVEQIARLEAGQVQARSVSERVAGLVTRSAGTAACAIFHAVWFAAWILVNTGFVRRIRPFDPFPFSLLTTIVSLEAIFLSIWILISQNQMARQADRREHLDLQINLLAEQESTATLRLVQRLAEHFRLEPDTPDHALTTDTDIEHVAGMVDEALPDPGVSSPMPPPPIRS